VVFVARFWIDDAERRITVGAVSVRRTIAFCGVALGRAEMAVDKHNAATLTAFVNNMIAVTSQQKIQIDYARHATHLYISLSSRHTASLAGTFCSLDVVHYGGLWLLLLIRRHFLANA
jgi:hypothetical protein